MTIVLYGLASALFLAWLLYKAGAFLIAIIAQTLPSMIERASTTAWSEWTLPECTLAAIGVSWNGLLAYVSLRLVFGTPQRLAQWWRTSDTAH